MKITVEVNQKTIDNLNNALVAYWDIITAAKLKLELPMKFVAFGALSDEELMDKFLSLYDLYKEIEEKYVNNQGDRCSSA